MIGAPGILQRGSVTLLQENPNFSLSFNEKKHFSCGRTCRYSKYIKLLRSHGSLKLLRNLCKIRAGLDTLHY